MGSSLIALRTYSGSIATAWPAAHGRSARHARVETIAKPGPDPPSRAADRRAARSLVTLRGVMRPAAMPGTLTVRIDRNRLRGAGPVQSLTYEITFIGQADNALRAEFDDCEIIDGAGTTILRAELPDQAALLGLLLRITGLRLELLHMRMVTPPPE